MEQTLLNLSKTEILVLKNVAKGLQNKEISENLCKSKHTIKNHKANCCLKLGFNTTRELIKWCIENATLLHRGGGKKLVKLY
jgi:DNA-binding NarL/FixJ family response regulator